MPVLYHAKALIDLAVRDTAGQPVSGDPIAVPPSGPGLAEVVRAGTLLHIYAENVTAGGYSNRAAITPDGRSVWNAAGCLQKL